MMRRVNSVAGLPVLKQQLDLSNFPIISELSPRVTEGDVREFIVSCDKFQREVAFCQRSFLGERTIGLEAS